MVTCLANLPFWFYLPLFLPDSYSISVPQNLTVDHLLLFQTRDNQITDAAPELSTFMSNCLCVHSVNKHFWKPNLSKLLLSPWDGPPKPLITYLKLNSSGPPNLSLTLIFHHFSESQHSPLALTSLNTCPYLSHPYCPVTSPIALLFRPHSDSPLFLPTFIFRASVCTLVTSSIISSHCFPSASWGPLANQSIQSKPSILKTDLIMWLMETSRVMFPH